jgi:hypothetical protein
LAGWQSGYAAACKAVDAGSIPTPASKRKGSSFEEPFLFALICVFIAHLLREVMIEQMFGGEGGI